MNEQERKLKAAVAAYMADKAADGMAATTILNYGKRLEKFVDFYTNSEFSEQEPDYTVMAAYKQKLSADGLKVSTIAQYITELGMFFRWCADPGKGAARFYENSPVAGSLRPNTRRANSRPYQEILTAEQAAKLWLNDPVKSTRPEKWVRNYAIVVLLLSTDIRNGELLSLTPADLDFEEEVIVIQHGKGDKYRMIDFPVIAQSALKLYLAAKVRPSYATDTDPLFGTKAAEDGRTMCEDMWHKGSGQWLSSVVERHVRMVTGVRNVRTHDLRHVGARLDLQNGMGIEELQAKLGHSSPVTTQIYSGKLLPRTGRKAAHEAFVVRDEEAKRNFTLLALA